MKKILSLLVLLQIAVLPVTAYNYVIYNPQEKTTKNSEMFTIGYSTPNAYKIGFLVPSEFLTCEIKTIGYTEQGYAGGICVEMGSDNAMFWRETSKNTFFEEMSSIVKERGNLQLVIGE